MRWKNKNGIIKEIKNKKMLRIRLYRTGRKKQPFYKIVVTDKRKPPSSGRFVEDVGFYNPLTKECKLKDEKIKYWMEKGAKPSDVVYNLLIKKGVIEGEKINVVFFSKKRKEKMLKEKEGKEKEDSKKVEDAKTEEKDEIKDEETVKEKEEEEKEVEKTEESDDKEEEKEEESKKTEK